MAVFEPKSTAIDHLGSLDRPRREASYLLKAPARAGAKPLIPVWLTTDR
jgi:hypothetical protein